MDITTLLSRADAGDVEAQCELAQRLHEGDGVPVDRPAAIA